MTTGYPGLSLGGLTFAHMYQLGFVVRDIERASANFRTLFGIERFRILRHGPDIATAHAYVGDIMVELVEVGPDGPSYFQRYIPVEPERAVFHHHAYRVFDQSAWDGIGSAAKSLGFECDTVSVKDGDMKVMFVDLRPVTGVFAEYVYLTGSAVTYYDDVPRN